MDIIPIYSELNDRNKSNTRSGLPWNETEISLLINSTLNKLSIEEIANKHGRSINSIQLKLNNIISKYYFIDKLTIDEIIILTGQTLDQINNIIIRNEIPINVSSPIKKKIIDKPIKQITDVHIKQFNELLGKNILVFDTETTGLPKFKKATDEPSNGLSNGYHHYKCNIMYDSSRIVSIGWILIKDFDYNKINYNVINENIIKPSGFIISKEITLIHGISHEYASENGTSLAYIINKCGLGNAIMKADYLVAHNCLFDLHILLNECYRIKFKQCEEKLKKMLDNEKYLCTLKFSRSCLNLKKNNLGAIYHNFYNEDPVVVHSAKADVDTLLKILFKLYEIINKTKINLICTQLNLDNLNDINDYIEVMQEQLIKDRLILNI